MCRASRPTSAAASTGVAYFDAQGHEHFQRARAVVLAANGAETPRLLLNSANPRFPQGLANSSGLVGKYLMFNYTARVNALFEHELNEYKSVQVHAHPPRLLRLGSQARFLWRWRDRCAHRTATHLLGGARRDRCIARPGARHTRIACANFRAPCRSPATPRRSRSNRNNVTLDPTLKDAWGIPAIRVTYRDHPDDLAMARFLQDRGVEIMDAAGALRVTKGADHGK